jgi:hypothetical protein
MCATRTPGRARAMRRPVGTNRWGCRSTTSAGPDVEALLERIRAGDRMTVGELLHAATVLDRLVPTRRLDVLVARVRIAVRLEQLGA